jgi:hypothetical protein
MKVKQIYIPLLAAILLISVSGCKEKAEEVEEAPSAAEIVDKYVDTLVTAPGKARDAAADVQKRTEAEEKALKELE